LNLKSPTTQQTWATTTGARNFGIKCNYSNIKAEMS